MQKCNLAAKRLNASPCVRGHACGVGNPSLRRNERYENRRWCADVYKWKTKKSSHITEKFISRLKKILNYSTMLDE